MGRPRPHRAHRRTQPARSRDLRRRLPRLARNRPDDPPNPDRRKPSRNPRRHRTNAIPVRPAYLAANDLEHARAAATDALRWAIHRRQQYLGRNDPWTIDAVTIWAWRATRQDIDSAWTDADTERDIQAWQIRNTGREPASG